MGSELLSGTIGDVFDLVNGYAFKSRDFVDDGIPVIKIKNVKAGYFSKHEFSYLDEQFLAARGDKLAQRDDLLISITGNRHDGTPETWVGKVARFQEDDPYFLNQRVGALRLKQNEGFSARYFGYLLSSWFYQDLFISIATSSGGQANLSPKQILEAPVEYPSFPEQETIAHILGTLDDKIELNRRMNETLESMARALFKSWFVDFDPVIDNALAAGNSIPEPLAARAATRRALGPARKPLPENIRTLFPATFAFDEEMGWIPEGWEISDVGTEFNVTMGSSPPGHTYNEEENGTPFFQGSTDFGFRFPTRRVYCTAPKRMAELDDTLVSVRAPVGDLNMAAEPCCVGRGLAAVRHRSGSRSFTYYAMLHMREQLNVYEAEGTVFGSINQKDFKALPQLAVAPELVSRFESTAESLDEKIECNSQGIGTLIKLRDTLLPKLLSGELRIPEAEKLVADCV